MPDLTCDVAIVGGGIVGASLAYHLTRRGIRDVILLEKEPDLGTRSTAKAAGGIRAQFGSDINVELSKISIDHFERFPTEMGTEISFFQVGYLWMAKTTAEMDLFRRNVALQRRHGLDVKLLSPREVAELAPYARTDDLTGGTFHARDGYAPPADYLQAYARKAKEQGARLLCGTPVTGILLRNGRVAGVKTPSGEIAARHVLCAAGAYSAEIGRMAGLTLPIEPVRRQCFVTHPLPQLRHPIPMTVDYHSGVYLHSESGGLLIGKADENEPPSFNESVDHSFLERIAELAMERVPALAEAGIKTGWAGLYEVTPDHHPILGPVPSLPGFWCAAGFSGHGVMHAPAAGMMLAEWIVDGKPSLDLTPLRLSRFQEGALISETHVI